MKTLNLVNPKKSDIKYQINNYPDGQNDVILNTSEEYEHMCSVQIISRFTSWKDLELIVCAKKALQNLGVTNVHLKIPYLLGARSDRRFNIGGVRYLSQIVAPVINSLNFKSVECLDVHSNVAENVIDNFENINNRQLVTWAIGNIYNDLLLNIFNDFSKCILVAPDAGATHKIYKLAEQIGYKGDIITCSKERAADGKLTKTVVPLKAQDLTKDFIIIDDICDGGATFINIAKELRSDNYKKKKIYLIVTHGIFSKGFKELIQYFDGIYCTNSYRDVADNEYEQNTKVKQLNIY